MTLFFQLRDLRDVIPDKIKNAFNDNLKCNFIGPVGFMS